jgi:hypothetical protein
LTTKAATSSFLGEGEGEYERRHEPNAKRDDCLGLIQSLDVLGRTPGMACTQSRTTFLAQGVSAPTITDIGGKRDRSKTAAICATWWTSLEGLRDADPEPDSSRQQ